MATIELIACVDRISNLPSNPTRRILESLPLRDAVRTSILSTYWRYKFSLVSKLIFDPSFFASVPKLQGKWYRNSDGTFDATILEYYPNVVDNVLLCQVGPIHEFVLYIPSWLPHDANISNWIQFLSGKSVQQFTLRQEFSKIGNRKLPSCMFSCAGFENLTHLTLGNFSLPSFPTTFRGFSCLTSLHVDMVAYIPTVGEANKMGVLVSKCPLLENLYFRVCEEESCLSIRAPNLRDLVVKGRLSSICLKETENLKTLSLQASWEHKRHMVMEFLTSLPHIEKLVLVGNFCMATKVGHPEKLKLPSEFRQLEHVIVDRVPLDCQWDVSSVLRLLQMAPKLQQLEIDVSSIAQPSADIMIVEEDCCLYYLKCATLSCGLYGSRIMLQLTKLILLSSPVLEVLNIKARVQGEEEEKLNIAKELLRCRRASINVKIIFRT